jgi:hypothetical protein
LGLLLEKNRLLRVDAQDSSGRFEKRTAGEFRLAVE